VADCVIMLGESSDQWKAMPCMLYVYVPDVDAVYRRAIDAGATSIKEPQDQFYGDRTAGVQDVCGNQWWLGTRKEDLSNEELVRRHEEARAVKV
jgi:PhnB protein